MTGRGRPTTGTKIQVRIPAELLAEIDAWAKDNGLTRSASIREAVQFYLSTR